MVHCFLSVALLMRALAGAAPAEGSSRPQVAGRLVNTGDPLHLALDGSGFFQLTTPNGELRYTRCGMLRLNVNGCLVTQDGYPMYPQLTVPADVLAIVIDPDGKVAVISAGSPKTAVVIGQLTLARFRNGNGLSAEGHNLLSETESSGPAIIATPGQSGTGRVRQGFLEVPDFASILEATPLVELIRWAFTAGTQTARK